MFKLDGTYYMCASDLHGWNTSVNYVIESTTSNIQGSYTGEYILPGTEMDYSRQFVSFDRRSRDWSKDRWPDERRANMDRLKNISRKFLLD